MRISPFATRAWDEPTESKRASGSRAARGRADIYFAQGYQDTSRLPMSYLNHHSMGDHPVFGDNHDAVANVIMRMVHFVGLSGGRNDHVVPNAGVLIHDRILDAAIGAHPDARLPGCLMLFDRFARLIIVTAQQDRPVQNGARSDDAAQSNDTVTDGGSVDDAAVGNHGMIDLGTVDLRTRQKTRPAENGRAHIEKVKARQFVSDIQVGLEKSPDGPNVLPITLEDVRINPQVVDCLRDDMFSKIG